MRRQAKALFAGSNQGSGTRRGLIGLVCLCVLGLAAFLGSSAPSAGAQACPNEAFRNGTSAYLPDCRAYEMVSPPEKEGQQTDDAFSDTAAPGALSSRDGNKAVWSSISGAFGDAVSSGVASPFVSRRGANWSSEGIAPPLGPYAFLAGSNIYGFTDDLGKMMLSSGWIPALTPEASENTLNTYTKDLDTGAYRLVTVGAPAGVVFEAFGEGKFEPGGISEDASHVVFYTPTVPFTLNIELTEDSAAAVPPYLYDWNEATGGVSLIGRLPDNSVSTKKITLAGEAYQRTVSADGSRIFFHEAGGECGVCVRVNAAFTELVSETATFQAASSDGMVAFVTDGGELERYDATTEVLTPLTAGAELQGVLGASADGSRIYFVGKGELAPGATAGQNNLYLWTDGAGIDFIATGNAASAFTNNWAAPSQQRSSRVTPNGMHLAFQANNSLTGFPSGGTTQVYLYSAATGELVCASCVVAEPAFGAFVSGGTNFSIKRLARHLADDGGRLFFTTDEALVARDSNDAEDIYEYDAAGGEVALITPGTQEDRNFTSMFNDASPSGDDLFFQTNERLVGTDTDAAIDVYDARVGGGLASQYPSSTPPCTGDACRGQSSSPDLAGAASAGFVGKGNVSQKQNCNKLGREAKKLSNRAKRLRKNAKQAQRNGKSGVAKKRNKKANRLAKQARNKSKSAKRCRKANRRASK